MRERNRRWCSGRPVRASVSWRTKWPRAPQEMQQGRRARGGACEEAWAVTSEPVERGADVAPAAGEARTIADDASPARP
ncbi:MAG TPA: hypothetical protein VEI94_00385 [Candidatus Bathyarchaeia archaeon]|nr:hypothetical protein [Candidatus Bathyarchaeia archaeon]